MSFLFCIFFASFRIYNFHPFIAKQSGVGKEEKEGRKGGEGTLKFFRIRSSTNL